MICTYKDNIEIQAKNLLKHFRGHIKVKGQISGQLFVRALRPFLGNSIHEFKTA